MPNQIFLSAASFKKYFERFPVEQSIDLPVVGSVVIAAKELEFNTQKISIPVHHHIPLLPDFDLTLEEFKCHKTGLSFEIGRIGILSGNALELLCQVFAGKIQSKLGEANVRVEESRIFLDAASFLPKGLQDLKLTEIQILSGADAGIKIEFEF